MDPLQPVYNAYFKAQDRFVQHQAPDGFEPDIIQDYIHWSMTLASYYEEGSEYESILLCELYLRRLYFHMLEAIQNPKHSRIFRRVCLDSIHTPLLCLKRYYYQWEDGDVKFLSLQQQLRCIQAPHD
ncbi:hypothetical protein [Vibrio panuliri]|uniref:Uncharacterized protein n=1 Tax=Vibrio panuliri TaxID=1381081 RepID=A0A1Q9HR62_9VIBR|nr:hypothetical protein [Vibrio panuliri]KAB1458207.1 hypothetical protein F7O85_10910 [Vibrio panuliri]OLQ88536.1 hypothetical protein BIY20_13130 [Vibrio panuliri]OLQ93322.1 hypothetical protein BIY22_02190 [Vibrio panuliri]